MKTNAIERTVMSVSDIYKISVCPCLLRFLYFCIISFVFLSVFYCWYSLFSFVLYICSYIVVCFFVLSLHFGSVVFAGNHHARYVDTWIRVGMLMYVYIMIYVPWSLSVPKPRLLLLVRGGLGLCSADPRPGYWSNLSCDWLGADWACLVVRPVQLGGTAPSRISGDDLPLTARSAILSAGLVYT